MADVLIKGLDMPTKGNPFTVLIYPDGTATWKDNEYQAVPVPPHGRLIDADDVDTITVICNERGLLKAIDAPVIIPASEVDRDS